ncbi:hypothetical protein TTHERM_00497670 (macronuclear) [Tetrahymena thermophila SB210]|uniref:Uncharacterized protein n=1 Tax=Tetrahymena thermophila (strain SB210) TaxID=312017 RepID=I7MK06_TETTS|nr:hypothetical protein TTHERM_00497670 [Tetrahymena thermophila SB210]EAS07713.2 hypothetical protein TTHERM_00497670 [Tetrahymena thermophila SB210]|eukprot:XP_001027955.2 hypothetical protein TTHERM_00497670 [Tetrahymena thermophila SB210]
MDCLITKSEFSQKEESKGEIMQNSDQQNTNEQSIQQEQQTKNDDGQAKPETEKKVIESDFIKNLRMLREQQKEKIDSFKQQKVELQQKKVESELQAFEKFKEEKILKTKENQDQKDCSKNSEANIKKKVEEKAKLLLNENLIKAHESLFLRKPIEKRTSQPANLKKKKKYLPTDIKYSLLIQQHIQQKKKFKNKFIRKPQQQSKKAQVYKGEGETVFVYKQPPKHPKEIDEQEQKRIIKVYDNKVDEESTKKQYKKLVSDEEYENKNKSDANKQKTQKQISIPMQNKYQDQQEQKYVLKDQKLNPKETYNQQISENLKQNDFQLQQSKLQKINQVIYNNQKPVEQKQAQNQQNLQDYNKKSEQNQLSQNIFQNLQERRENKIQTQNNENQNGNKNYIQQKFTKSQSDTENNLNQKQKQMQNDTNKFQNEANDFKKQSQTHKQSKQKDTLKEEDEFEYKKFSSKEDYQKQKQQQLHDIVSQKLSKLQLQAQNKLQKPQNQNEGNNNTSATQKYLDQRYSGLQEKIVDVNFLKQQYLDQNSLKNYNNQQQTDRERSRDYKQDQKKQGIQQNNNLKKSGLETNKNKNSNFIDVEDDSDKEVNEFLLNTNIKNFIKTQSQIIEECQKQIMEEKMKESQETKQKETKSILKNGQNQQGKYSLVKDQDSKLKGYNNEKMNLGQTYKSPLNMPQTRLHDEQFINRIQNNSNKQINLELQKNNHDFYEIEDKNFYKEDQNINFQNQFYDRKFQNNMNPNQKNKQNVINQILDVRPIQIINDRPIQIIDESQIQYYDERQVNYIQGNNQNYIDRLARRSPYDDKIRQYQPQSYESQTYFYDNPKRRVLRQDFQQFQDNFIGNHAVEVDDYDHSSQFLRCQNLYNTPRGREIINNVNINPQIPPPSNNSKITRDFNFLHQGSSNKDIEMQKPKSKIEMPKTQSQNQFLNDYFSQAKEQDRQTLAQMFEGINRFKQFNVDSFY